MGLVLKKKNRKKRIKNINNIKEERITMNKEEIRKALDHFENDKFMDAKEILSKEIITRKNEWIKNKLELKNDIETKEPIDKGDKGDE